MSKKAYSKRITGVVVMLALALLAGIPLRAYADDPTTYFPETGHNVSGQFLNYWQTHGALSQQGFPISDEFQEVSDLNGQTYTVQYFERAVFEKHPENQAPFDVLLSQLGKFQYDKKYPGGAPNQTQNKTNANFFNQTGHWVGGKFWAYWQAHGGLAQQGYPISDEFMEVSDLNHQTYLVQYFERAVFEYHPENQPPYDVLLSQLGKFRFRDKYTSAGTSPTATTAPNVPTATPTLTPTPAPVAKPAAPALNSPGEGAVLRVYPRVATFTWAPVNYPGGVTYNIEVQINTGSWQPFAQQTGLAAGTYTMAAFTGDNPGRWRVSATGGNGVTGDPTQWRAFSFNTGADQYEGTWLNNDLGTGGVAKLWITRSGQMLSVHWFGSCGGGLCDNGSRDGQFVGEPFEITFPGPPSNAFSITLANDEGSQLKLVNVGSASGTNTYTFRRARAQYYSGTWLNSDPNTGGVKKLELAGSGDTLSVHWYGACGGGLCDNGTLSKTYNGEPFVITFPGPPSHQFTITFDNAALSKLKVVDVGSASGTNTYYFDKQ